MPDYFVYRKNDKWFVKRNRHKGEVMDGEVFNIFAKTRERALASAQKIVGDIEKMNVEAQGSSVSQSTQTKTEETKGGKNE